MEHFKNMNFEYINYEITLWKNGSLILDGVSIVKAIRNWWGGKLGLADLFIKFLDLSITLINRYFNTDKSQAVANAYITLGLSPRAKNSKVIMKRYKKLAKINHPDKGGRLETMREINVSRDIILASLLYD